MAVDNIEYYKHNCIQENEHTTIDLIEKDGYFYIIDGNHRINILKLLLAVKPNDGYSKKIKAHVRHIPQNLDFVKEFVKMITDYKLFDEELDELDNYYYYTPHFRLEGDYNNPTFIHIESNIAIRNIEDIHNFEEQLKSNYKK